MSDNPNVVLICTDHWRGDCLSIDGHPALHTPHLDALAQRGTRFARAYSACPTCIPARATLHSGLAHDTTGIVGFNWKAPWNFAHTLAGEFTKQGYQTQAIGKMHTHPARNHIGFEGVILQSAFGIIKQAQLEGQPPEAVDDYIPWLRERVVGMPAGREHGIESNSWVARPWHLDERLHYTNFTTEQAVRFLSRRDTTRPFFMFLSYNAPHPPFDPPGWLLDMYLNMDLPEPPVGDWADMFEKRWKNWQHDCAHGKLRPDLRKRALAGFYAMMTHVDHQINHFIETLGAFGLSSNTVFMFTSDHGEMAGDHHMFRKSLPFEGSARVPLIVAAPGAGLPRNRVVNDAIVELRDIMPTLLDAAGLQIPAGLDGRSVMPFVRGQDEHTIDWRDHLHGEHPHARECVQWITTSNRLKYIWFSGSGSELLFDLSKDPREERDLSKKGSHKGELERCRNLLIEHLEGRQEGYVQDGRLITGCKPETLLHSAIARRDGKA